MQKTKRQQINIGQINFIDWSYVVTFEPILTPLITSIKKVGLLNPPILESTTDGRLRIVSGWKRIIALKHLNITDFNAQIYFSVDNSPCLELFLLNIYENSAIREFNVIEKANILQKLINIFKMPPQKILDDIFPLLELGRNPNTIDRYLPLVLLTDNLKIGLVEDTLSFETALELAKMTIEEAAVVSDLFFELKFGKNRQREFLILLKDIAAIYQMSVEQILEKNDIQIIIKDNSLTPAVKINRIKKILTQLRYPRFSQTEENFAQIRKTLKLPPDISLIPPDFFEGKKYRLELTFERQADLEKALQLLSTENRQQQFKKLENLI